MRQSGDRHLRQSAFSEPERDEHDADVRAWRALIVAAGAAAAAVAAAVLTVVAAVAAPSPEAALQNRRSRVPAAGMHLDEDWTRDHAAARRQQIRQEIAIIDATWTRNAEALRRRQLLASELNRLQR